MKRTRLKPVSKQKALDNIKYRKAKEQWTEKRIGEDGYLQCQFIGKPYAKDSIYVWPYDDEDRCILNGMESPHHKKGRHGSLLYDKRYFLSLCEFHHSWVHDHAREARKRKYLLF